MASGKQPATGLECVFLIWHNLRYPCYVDPNGRCMGGPGLHPAVRSDAGPRAHSVARISQFFLRALLCKGLASSCGQTENKEAARLHHVVPTAQCMQNCLSQARHLYKPLLCDKGGQVSAKGCQMLRRCQDASLRQPRQGTCASLKKAPLYERSKFEAWAFVLALQLVRRVTVQLSTWQRSRSCSS